MQLKELLSHVQTIKSEGPLDREIAGIAYDSRRVTPGMVFVAVPGRNTDGHDHILSAVERGAAAIICQRNGLVPQRATKIKVADSRAALAQAAAAYYAHPSRRLKVVGITGTNGKTTVAFMVKQMLEAAGLKSGLVGTVRYEIGERMIPAQRTTPEAPEIQQMMAQMLRAQCQACVMEVSSHALEQRRVSAVEFDAAAFTNLTQDHLDYHGTMEDYFAAKQKLFAALETGAKPAVAVINVDDPYGERLTRATRAETLLTFGFSERAKIRARRVQLGRDATDLVVRTPEGEFSCRLPLIGRHNVYNALAAIGVAVGLQIGIESIGNTLSATTPVPGRLERVDRGQPFGIFVDYAHTDDALKNVLTTLREITSGRLLLVFGCGGNRDAGKRPKMGAVAASLADFTLITSDNPRRESAAKIAEQIEAGYRAVRAEGYRIELDRRQAIDDGIRMAVPGDTLLIAGKGHETYQEFEDTVVPFDDRIYGQETLTTLGYLL